MGDKFDEKKDTDAEFRQAQIVARLPVMLALSPLIKENSILNTTLPIQFTFGRCEETSKK